MNSMRLPQDSSVMEVSIERRLQAEFEGEIRGVEGQCEKWRNRAVELEGKLRRLEGVHTQVIGSCDDSMIPYRLWRL